MVGTVGGRGSSRAAVRRRELTGVALERADTSGVEQRAAVVLERGELYKRCAGCYGSCGTSRWSSEHRRARGPTGTRSRRPEPQHGGNAPACGRPSFPSLCESLHGGGAGLTLSTAVVAWGHTGTSRRLAAGRRRSWLLELGDGWALVMIATGLYLLVAPGTRRPSAVAALSFRHACVAARPAFMRRGVVRSGVRVPSSSARCRGRRSGAGRFSRQWRSSIGQTSPTGFSPGGASVEQFEQALQPVEPSRLSSSRSRSSWHAGCAARPMARRAAVHHEHARQAVAGPHAACRRGERCNSG